MRLSRRVLSCALCFGIIFSSIPLRAAIDPVSEGADFASFDPAVGSNAGTGDAFLKLGSFDTSFAFMPLPVVGAFTLADEYAGPSPMFRQFQSQLGKKLSSQPLQAELHQQGVAHNAEQQLTGVVAGGAKAQQLLSESGSIEGARETASESFVTEDRKSSEDSDDDPVATTDSPASQSVAKLGKSARAGGKESLADRLRSEPDALFGPTFPSRPRKFIQEVLIPQLGLISVLTAVNSPRKLEATEDSLRLQTPSGEKALKVRWAVGLAEPEVDVEPGERVLHLPLGYSPSPDVWAEWMRRWLMGSSLHPLVSERSVVAKRHELGDPTFVPREVQDEGIKTGLAILQSDAEDKSFLYVAPTGTGKSHVIERLLGWLVLNSGKALHILTADKTHLVSQLVGSLSRLTERGQVRVAQWGGADNKAWRVETLLERTRAAKRDGKPLILVSTTQSLIERFYAAAEGVRKAARSLEDAVHELKENLGSVLFDEAHHAGAETAVRLITHLTEGSEAVKLGVTATPVHSVRSIQELFGFRAFWAYLDTVKEFFNPGEDRGVERSVEEILDQLSAAIDTGDLTPLRRFFAINPEELVPEDDLFIQQDADSGASRYVVNPEHYDKLIARLRPLFLRHRRGFLTAATMNEAEGMARALAEAVPNRRFAVLHSGMPKDNQQQVIARLKKNPKDSNAINFVVAVGMLDEGLDFPDFTLYVDINRGIGPRQFIQRLGRLTRIYPGKEGVDVAVLMDPLDENVVRENLAFLDRCLAGKFYGHQTYKGDEVPDLAAAGLGGLAEADNIEELRELAKSMRSFFTEEGGLIRYCNRFVERRKRLPAQDDHKEAAKFLFGLMSLPEGEWPDALSPDVRRLLRLGLPEFELLMALNRFVEHYDQLPTEDETEHKNKDAYKFYRWRLGQPEKHWPYGLSERVKELMRAEAESIHRVLALNRLVARISCLPSPEKHPDEYEYVNELMEQPEKDWPKDLSPQVIGLMRIKIRMKAELAQHVAELNRYVERYKALPSEPQILIFDRLAEFTKVEDCRRALKALELLQTISMDRWPEDVSDDVRELLTRKDVPEKKGRPIDLLNRFVEDNGRLPNTGENDRLETYVDEKVSQDSSYWRGMSTRTFELMRARRAAFVQARSIRRLNEFTASRHRLPSVQDAGRHWGEAIERAGILLKTPDGEWSSELSEETRSLLRVGDVAAIINAFVARHDSLPSASDHPEAARYLEPLLESKEPLPEELSSRARELIRETRVIRRINVFVERRSELPNPRQDMEAFAYWIQLLDRTPADWGSALLPQAIEKIRVEASEFAPSRDEGHREDIKRYIDYLNDVARQCGILSVAAELRSSLNKWRTSRREFLLARPEGTWWPEGLAEETKALLRQMFIPLDIVVQINEEAALHGRLYSSNPALRPYVDKFLGLHKDQWSPFFSDDARKLLREASAAREAGSKEPRVLSERRAGALLLNAFVQKYRRLPFYESDPASFREALGIMMGGRNAVSDELDARAATLLRRWENTETTVEFLNEFAGTRQNPPSREDTTGWTPTWSEGAADYDLYEDWLRDTANRWPEDLTKEARSLLHRAQASLAAERAPLIAAINTYAERHPQAPLPTKEANLTAFRFLRDLMGGPEEYWPAELDQAVRKAMTRQVFRSYAVKYINQFVLQKTGLPVPGEDEEVYFYMRWLMNFSSDKWPKNLSEEAKLRMENETARAAKIKAEAIQYVNDYARQHRRLAPLEGQTEIAWYLHWALASPNDWPQQIDSRVRTWMLRSLQQATRKLSGPEIFPTKKS